MTTTNPVTRTEALAAGYVAIGVWGYGSRDAGRIYALPADADAVRVAYDAIPCDDDYPADGTIEDVFAAGGIYVSDRPAGK